jgi:hypothetical protein
MGVPALTERTSAQYKAQLQDPTGAGVPASTLLTLALTLYDLATGTVINGRSQQNVLNANNVTVDASGNLVWAIQGADNSIVTASLAIETHIALFEASWATGECKHEVSLPVRNVNRVTS